MTGLRPEWYLTAAIVVVTVVLAVVGRWLRREGHVAEPVIIAVFLSLTVWVPELWRDGLIVFALAVAGAIMADGMGGKIILFFLLGGISAGLAWLIPGGTMPLLLAVLAILGFVELRDAGRHLGRLSRARRLNPGERVEGEVEVGGVVGAETVAPPPTLAFECAAWQIQVVGEDGARKAHPSLLSLQGPHGTVHVDLERVELRVDDERKTSLSGEPAAAALRSVGIRAEVEIKTLEDGTELKKPIVDVRYLPPRHEVYVVGTPQWESVRGGGYRDSTLVPVFRDQDKGFVVDRSDLEERRRAYWTLWQWGSWGAVCVGIAVVQVVFGVL